jgi:hypothetical protein
VKHKETRGKQEMNSNFDRKNLKEKDALGGLDLDYGIILKRIIRIVY